MAFTRIWNSVIILGGHTTYTQTSHGQICDPQTQICSYPSIQAQQGHGTQGSGVNQYGQFGQGGYRNRNEGQYHQYGNTGQPSNAQHGIDSKLDFGGSVQQTTSNTQGHRIYVQTSRGISQCNPQTQNCGTSIGTSSNTNYGFSSTQNCNPQTHDCRQGSATVYQTYGSSVPTCDPRTQNCGQSYSNSYGQSFAVGCDPRFQNCGRDHGNTQQHAHDHLTAPSSSYTPGQVCDPRDQRCIYSHGANQQTSSFGNSQTHGSGQQNYHKVCNINDSNCQRNRTSVTKKSKEPKCPEDFQGITKHPTDCKKFLNCANGLTFIQDCAPGTLFNPFIGNCDFPYNVECSNNETDEVTEHYEESTKISDWEKTYLEHAQKYGQNAGHGKHKINMTDVSNDISIILIIHYYIHYRKY